MSVDVTRIINEAYREIGDVGDGMAAQGEQVVTGIDKLNDVVARLNLENYLHHTYKMVDFSPSESKSSYTIGIAADGDDPADIVADRPVSIQRMYYSYTPSSVCVDVTLVDPSDLYLYQVAATAQSVPLWAAYVPEYPLGLIKLPYQLMTGTTLHIVYNKDIPKLSVGETVLDIPNEYQQLLIYALADSLCVRYGKPSEGRQYIAGELQACKDAITMASTRNRPLSARLQLMGNSTRSRVPDSIWSVGNW